MDIDTQHDFMDPSGALYVPGAEKLVGNLRTLLQYARKRMIPVIASADCHSHDDPEFKQFPPHCVAGTEGQKKLPDTLLQPQCVIEPDQHVTDFSTLLRQNRQIIFHKQALDVFSNPNAARLVEQLQVDQFVVFGVTTEYCVKAAVEGLLARRKPVTLVIDAVTALDDAVGRDVLQQFASRGVAMQRTEQIVGQTGNTT